MFLLRYTIKHTVSGQKSKKISLALCSFYAYWPSAPYPMLLYATSLDRQIIAECNHIRIFFYNLNSFLTIGILQK